ncbi:cell surface protein SprA [Bernardetia sp.]|uniref:T9SS outer membrane translocon Sov/SprA n=1 Tax=Bernardetia sp. TaxID=1937974 RepID=UPI0025BD1EC5|nr:cell surface protein SprA [Bernardetia sp.]
MQRTLFAQPNFTLYLHIAKSLFSYSFVRFLIATLGCLLITKAAQAQDTTTVNNIDSLLFLDKNVKPYTEEGQTQNPLLEPDLESPLLQLPDPRSLDAVYRLDESGEFYDVLRRDAPNSYTPIGRISVEDYAKLKAYYDDVAYYKEKIQAADVNTSNATTSKVPKIEVALPSGLGRLLGGDKIEIQPTGSVLLDFGGKWQRIDNPQIPVRQQRNGGINFDQRIQFSILGKLGEKMQLNANFDTKAAFQFENRFNQGYTGYEEDIVQQVQFGNVSLATSNTLITGSQNLMGITTRLRFGKLWLNTLVANQRGVSESITIRNGAQGQEFEIRADQYEDNQHFFLGQFFRDNYEQALRAVPSVVSGVNITRVEVYITNRNNDTETLRNIIGFMDLGEGAPYRERFNGQGGVARNEANNLFEQVRTLNRTPDQLTQLLESGAFNLENGTDYSFLRSARKLSNNEFTFHPQLGYISLQQPLRNDEILAVAYEYTYNGQIFKVGELTEDYQNRDANDAIFMKLLSPPTIRTDLPLWDLMMKNIYSLQATQLRPENFQLQVIYRDDITGIDNPSLHEGRNTEDVPLVQLMNLDRLNPNLDPQVDGNFDYLENITVQSDQARIIFPVVEPFGDKMLEYFDPVAEVDLIEKYVFNELYDGTQADAVLYANKSKYFLKGSYQSAGGNEVVLPGINISEGSVMVRAGSVMLSEGADYTVDYQFGRVRILNEGVLASGKDITIQYERADLFSVQQRNIMGIDAEYILNKDVKFSGTLLHLNERPVITRVTTGLEPVRNTMIGATASIQKESGFLTRMVDAIPGLDTKEKSTITFRGEYAQLIPGENNVIKRNGGEAASYVDDFESSEIPYDLTRQPVTWKLGATPQLFRPENGFDSLNYSYKRAKMSWHTVDVTAFYDNSLVSQTPDNITDQDKQNHYVRQIPFDEIFQQRDNQQINPPEITFDLAYYPSYPGQYNYNPELNVDGTLRNPRENFAAITKGITYNVDFDNINVQYIEFWLMDPFIQSQNGRIETPEGQGVPNSTGGKFYINLGNISEDVIPDRRHGFENGLPVNDNELDDVEETAWGRVTTQQYLTDAFAAEDGARARQDVGLDGLDDEAERSYFREYLNAVQPRLSASAFQRLEADPSKDNFRYYLGGEQDDNNRKILGRYFDFNGMEGNSPANAGTASATTLPDNEDLNRDNTLSDLDGYYQYEVDLRPNQLESNRYVVDKVTVERNGDQVNWYQFRIPIREFDDKIGSIDGFKSIRFIRLFMTDWEQPVVMRMAHFQFVGAQWRPYFSTLQDEGLARPVEPYDPQFTISTVNIEENGSDAAPNSQGISYALPPDFVRDTDPTSITQARLNEQSLQLCVEDLQDGDSRAAYKNIIFDFVFYKRIKMFLHANSATAQNGEVTAFLRLGTDFKENYYEIEVPLTMSAAGSSLTNQIWLQENEIDLPFDALYDTKTERNASGLSVRVPYERIYEKYKLRVVGNPDLSSVQLIMIGIRNPKTLDEQPKSVCVWANELRVTDFNKEGGWATNLQLQTQLADFATVNAALRYSTPFFGGIQDRISERTRETSLFYDVSAATQLDKIFLNRVGISLPLFVGYEQTRITPLFNPLDPDIRLERSLETSFDNEEARREYRNLVQDRHTRRSINLTNVRKQRMNPEAKVDFWDIENFAASLSYNDSKRTNIRLATDELRETRFGLVYNYGFQIEPFEPFKKNELLNAPYLKFIRDFNFNYLPNNITVTGQVNRRFMKTQYRNAQLTTDGVAPFFQKSFFFDRNYAVQWNFTKSLLADYNATASAIIDEPAGELNTQEKRDSVWTNIQNLGRMKFFTQATTLNYRVPLDKFPAIDFLNADLRRSSNYTWTANAVGVADTLGNMARSSSQFLVNGQIDMQKLYNKSPYLREITAPKRTGRGNQNNSTSRPTASPKQKRLEYRIKKLRDKKTRKNKVRNIKLDRLVDSVLVDTIMVAQLDSSKMDKINEKYDKRIAKLSERQQRIEEKLKAEREKQKGKKGGSSGGGVGEGAVKALLSVKRITFNYSINGNTMLPNLLTTPSYFGLDQNFAAPGLPFVLGSQSRDNILDMANNGYLSQSAAQTNPIVQDQAKTLSLRVDVEPFKDFQLQVEGQRTQGANYSEVLRYDPFTDDYISETAVRTGNYNISYFSMATAFTGDDEFGNSPLFDDFIAARNEVKATLDAENPTGDYALGSQDVLIPSFLSAYSGRSTTSEFPRIPLPNWRLTYNGLTNLEVFKDRFRSISITHGYQSTYAVGSYTSSLLYDFSYLNLGITEYNVPLADIIDPETGELQPVFVVNQVSISERFSPLIGINIRTNNDITFRFNFNKDRMLSLNLSNSQLAEQRNNDFVFDVGFVRKGVKIPFTDVVLKNDLTFRCAVTLRDTKVIQRKIDTDGTQDSDFTGGNFNLQFKPTLAYMVNQRVNLTAYFDRAINRPRLSNSFPRYNTAFGVQVRFNLAQ